MKVLDGNTFLYFSDRNVSKVSGVWKALHIIIYISIAVNAFITSMAVGNMFQTFKYNCILFCNEVSFEQDVLPLDYLHHSKVIEGEGESNLENYGSPQNITDHNMLIKGNVSEIKNATEISLSSTNLSNSDKNIIETVSEDNNTVIFKNQTHIFRNEDESIVLIHGKIDMRKTRFGSNFWCNFVLGIALITFIFATFCGVILSMCSRGGKGRNNTLNRPQNMVYPILVSSIILGILNLTASVIVKNGMNDFCANFRLFTEEERCSSRINQFTIHERQDRFYLPYVVMSHSFTITIILFLSQILVTSLRIIYAVDYQLHALNVEETENDENYFEVEDGHIKERTV